MFSRHPRATALTILILLGVALVWAWIAYPRYHPKRVSILIPRSEGSALVVVQESKAHFKRKGLDVHLTTCPSMQECLLPLHSDFPSEKAPFAIADQANFVQDSFSHPELRLLGSLYVSHSDIKLALLKDTLPAGSTGKPPTWLKGKKIGLTGNPRALEFLDVLLSTAGLGLDSVQTIFLPDAMLLKGLKEHTLDAAVLREPKAFTLQKEEKDAVIFLTANSLYADHFLLLTNAEYLRHHESEVRHLLSGLVENERWMQSHEKEAADNAEKSLSLPPGYFVTTREEARYTLRLDQKLLSSLEETAHWQIRRKRTRATTIPNFLNYTAWEPLNHVDSARVTLIH